MQVARRRVSLCVRAAQVSSNDFKTGMTIEFDGAPWKVVGKLRAVQRVQPTEEGALIEDSDSFLKKEGVY